MRSLPAPAALSVAECLRLLATVPVGRIAFTCVMRRGQSTTPVGDRTGGTGALARGARPATPFAEHLQEHRQWAHGHPAPPATLHRALTFWTRLHGFLSLELAGHFTGMGFDPELLYTAELDDLTTPDDVARKIWAAAPM